MTVKAEGRTARRSGARAGTVEQLSRADRVARGKDARAAAPLESHAEFVPGGSRDPVGLLLGQARSRVPELVPIRHGRMLVSPFTFYRGAALPMAADLAGTPDVGAAGAVVRGRAPVQFRGVRLAGAAPGLRCQRLRRDASRPVRVGCQAAGGESFGGGAGQRVSGQGPPWDRPRGGRGLPHGDARLRAAVVAGGLVRAPGHRAGRSASSGPRSRRKGSRPARAMLAKAHTRDSMQALDKLTTVVDGQRQIIADPPMIVPIEEVFSDVQADALYKQLRAVLGKYRRSLQSDRRQLLEQFAMIQVARKVVGVGSVGTRAWVVLMETGDGIEPLFLQAKEAQPSVLAEYCGRSQVQQRRRAGRRRAAPDAGPKRHLPRLDPRHRRGRGRPRLLRAPVAGLEILRTHRTDASRRE